MRTLVAIATSFVVLRPAVIADPVNGGSSGGASRWVQTYSSGDSALLEVDNVVSAIVAASHAADRTRDEASLIRREDVAKAKAKTSADVGAAAAIDGGRPRRHLAAARGRARMQAHKDKGGKLLFADLFEKKKHAKADAKAEAKEKKDREKSEKMLFIGMVVLIVILLGIAAQLFLSDDKPKPVAPVAPAKAAPAPTPVAAAAAPKAAAEKTPSEPWKGKGKARGSRGSTNAVGADAAALKLEAFKKKQTMVKFMAIIRIHRTFWCYKVRKGIIKITKRYPAPNQKVVILATIHDCTNLPHVNTFGGIDPLCQLRAAYGKDPTGTPGVQFDVPNQVATKHCEANENPKWNEPLELRGLANREDHFLHLMVWDYNLTGNTAVCDACLNVPELLAGLSYDVAANDKFPKKEKAFENMKNIFNPKKLLKSVLSTSLAYVELHSFKITLVKADKLPKVDLMTTIDSIIEVRLVRYDPASKWEKSPEPAQLVWSGRTDPDAFKDNQHPDYNKEFSFEAPSIPSLNFELVLLASKAPLPDAPIAHCILRLADVGANPPLCKHGQEIEHTMPFQEIPTVGKAGDITESTLTFKISYDLLFDS
eukprot:TRINITY_DN177_c0_g2_i1.p1 TRINITY_DN177_c0_g2~~TRINITY_DN177_c0_g2_i1.p1  ORF type:complete len:595 (+),score=152.10 TRINITY_DN177_c0_g2_i1:170-1954(+)